MPIDLPPGHFFLPGPTEVHPDVLAAQTKPMIGHRGRAIEELLARLQDGLRRVFLTEQPVIISTSSATGLMEAAVRNGVAGGKCAESGQRGLLGEIRRDRHGLRP